MIGFRASRGHGADVARRAHGVVLAGSYRWGWTPFERLGPPAALPLLLRPLAVRALDWLAAAGVPRASVCANGSAARAVARAVSEARAPAGLHLDLVEDWTPRGPAGAVKDAAAGSDADHIIVVEAAVLPESVDLGRLLAEHAAGGRAATVCVRPLEREAGGSGSAAAARWSAPAGVYVFDRRALAGIREVGYQDIKEALVRRIYESGDAASRFEVTGACPRVHCRRTYLAASAWALERALGGSTRMPPDCGQQGTALVHDNAHVHPSARIVGPVLVGPFARVLEGATVVGPAVIGPGAAVLPEALLARSVLLGGAAVGRGAEVDRAILGEGAAVADGVTLSERVVLADDGETRPAGAAPGRARGGSPRHQGEEAHR